MTEAGAVIRFPMEQYTVMGLTEVLTKIPAHWRLLRGLGKELRAGRYDLVILVDYPEFNLRLALAAHAAKIPTLYFIAPQLWAWRPGRAATIRAAVNRMAVILPFEEEYFARLGITATFVGHPLAEMSWPSREESRTALGLRERDRVLVLFPGSRVQETHRLWPVFRAVGLHLLAEGACDTVLVAATPGSDYPDSGAIIVHRGESAHLLAAADAALVKSGTTTLESACTGTPMVVAYRVHPLTAWIARRMLSLDRISLVNLIGNAEIVPEFLQRAVGCEALVTAVRPLLDPTGPESRKQREALDLVRTRLGLPGAAQRVVALAEELLAA